MLKPLGPVTVAAAGTPVQAISVLPAADRLRQKDPNVHGVMVQALSTNGGKIYVGTKGLDKTTLANVIAVLGVPTDTVIPAFSAALTIAPNAIDLSDIYLDADTNDEGALVSILQT